MQAAEDPLMTKMSVYSKEKFAEDCEEVCSEYYSQQLPERGERMSRFHRSIEILLHSCQPDREDIANQVLSDGSDQGIDLLYVTEDEEPLIYVVQVKDHRKLDKQDQKTAVIKMVEEIRMLRQRQRIDKGWDERRQDRYRLLKENSKGTHKIKFVLLLTGGAEPRVETNDFSLGSFEPDFEFLEVYGLEELIQLEIENLAPPRPDVTFQIQNDASIQLMMEGKTKSLMTFLGGLSYVSAIEAHGSRIFKHNPRLFLGKASRTNKKMLETLESPEGRRSFHYFNNGITVVCDTLRIAPDGIVSVKDFQVVNGCQTTETLREFVKNEPKRLEDVLLPLRIIEVGNNSNLAQQISQFTNTQTPITSADLIALTPLQETFREELASLRKPIFYETRRGAWNSVSKVQREKYRVAHGEWGPKTVRNTRYLKLKELSQAMLAVTRSPNAAKEQISSLFINIGEGSQYAKVMESSWDEIEQVQLVVELYKFCSNKDNWMPEFDDADELRRFSEMAGLGRFYVMNLTYGQWAADLKHEIDPENPKLIDAGHSEIILRDFREKVGRLAEFAVQALLSVKEDDQLETRQLLRNSKYRVAIQNMFKIFLRVSDRAASVKL